MLSDYRIFFLQKRQKCLQCQESIPNHNILTIFRIVTIDINYGSKKDYKIQMKTIFLSLIENFNRSFRFNIIHIFQIARTNNIKKAFLYEKCQLCIQIKFGNLLKAIFSFNFLSVQLIAKKVPKLKRFSYIMNYWIRKCNFYPLPDPRGNGFFNDTTLCPYLANYWIQECSSYTFLDFRDNIF